MRCNTTRQFPNSKHIDTLIFLKLLYYALSFKHCQLKLLICNSM